MDPDLGLVVGQRRDQLTFDAFCETHQRAWLAAARARRLSEEQSRAVVGALRHWLRGEWQMLLREPVPAAEAWKVLKVEIAAAVAAAEANGGAGEPQEQWRLAIRAAAHRMRLTMRIAEDASGIYAAILALPERQQDVVVLHYALDLPEETVADYLGSTMATVRSNARHARNRLREKLGREGA
ncbi:RNA polymerase sigma factor [Kitasatospora phosalacinea]|uniref:RNA polymerase sigma factor n=1 Tax=Kitasatospora phosalacinea TaxID=2065 RepID=UPI0005279B8C|nr:sigma factor-like helix-turn-helix DNA-binding protein [Kitasatospora phosalacinea]